jgi:hypothetical protein
MTIRTGALVSDRDPANALSGSLDNNSATDCLKSRKIDFRSF